ncbi:hypothetical protein PG984_009613 [Apiospora sp. TS-2023a]
MAQLYQDEGISMSPDSSITTKSHGNLLDSDHDDRHEEAGEARRRLFQEQQKRDKRMQQALEAARKRMEAGRNTIERMIQEEATRTQTAGRMMQEETARTQKMERLEAECERMTREETMRTQRIRDLEAESQRLKSMLAQRDVSIAILTQTVIKERERFNNERVVFQKSIAATNTETEPTETLYVDDSLGVVSRKRKRGMPTPPTSDIAAMATKKPIQLTSMTDRKTTLQPFRPVQCQAELELLPPV